MILHSVKNQHFLRLLHFPLTFKNYSWISFQIQSFYHLIWVMSIGAMERETLRCQHLPPMMSAICSCFQTEPKARAVQSVLKRNNESHCFVHLPCLGMAAITNTEFSKMSCATCQIMSICAGKWIHSGQETMSFLHV